jgi:hypothetical protein
MTTWFEAIEGSNADAHERREALARPARCRFFITTFGVGESRLSSPLQFGALLMEEPSFSFGLISNSPIAAGSLPQATAVVLKWRRDGKFWVGADMGFRIQSADSKLIVTFSLVFEGMALRVSSVDANAKSVYKKYKQGGATLEDAQQADKDSVDVHRGEVIRAELNGIPSDQWRDALDSLLKVIDPTEAAALERAEDEHGLNSVEWKRIYRIALGRDRTQYKVQLSRVTGLNGIGSVEWRSALQLLLDLSRASDVTALATAESTYGLNSPEWTKAYKTLLRNDL